MTVLLRQSGAMICGPPRTGSRWVVRAVKAAGIPCWTAPGHQFPGSVPAATFIRHPVSWLDSMYRQPTGLPVTLGWRVSAPETSESLESWVGRVLDVHGVGEFFRQWLPPGIRVARYESLVPDLISLLREFGEEPVEDAIRELPAIGAGPPGQPWPDELVTEVLTADAEFIAEFYPLPGASRRPAG